ncbi:MAG: thioredoxin domain-containing protein [Pseudomonadota bacterium]
MNSSVILICKSCNTKNRVPEGRIKDNPKCGRCGHALEGRPAVSVPVSVTDQSFQKEVFDHNGVVLVQCWAPWCGHCRSMEPVLKALARDLAGRVKIARINVDENPATSTRFNIMGLPTILFIKNGTVRESVSGAMNRQDIEAVLKKIG